MIPNALQQVYGKLWTDFQYRPMGCPTTWGSARLGWAEGCWSVLHIHTDRGTHCCTVLYMLKHLQSKKQLNLSQEEKSIDSYEMPVLCLRRFLSCKQLATGGKYKGFIPVSLPQSRPLPPIPAICLSWRRDTGIGWNWAGPCRFGIILMYITFV